MFSPPLSRCVTVLVLALVTGCADAPTEPRVLAGGVSPNVTREHIEFDVYDDFDIVLTCVEGVTHWQGSVHVTIDAVTTPSGTASTRFRVEFAPDYFVEMPDGTRYYPVKFNVNEHHTDGTLTNIAGTAAGVFRSADGDTIALGFHVQVVYDPKGNTVVDWKFTGVCP